MKVNCIDMIFLDTLNIIAESSKTRFENADEVWEEVCEAMFWLAKTIGPRHTPNPCTLSL